MLAHILTELCKVDKDECRAMQVCKQNAIYYIKDDTDLLGGRIAVNYKKCTGCGECKKVCCSNAIVIG